MGRWWSVAGIGACLGSLVACGEAPSESLRFVEVTGERVPQVSQTEQIGDNAFFGPGAGAGDVDGDGRTDLYLGDAGLYLNKPDAAGFRLEHAPDRVPALDMTPLSVVFADYDRDGDPDLSVCGFGGVRLFANDGTGAFADVTDAAGVRGPSDEVCSELAWADFDGDGYLDLSVATYGTPTGGEGKASHLYLSQRDGSFVELAPLAQSDYARRSITTSFADFDGDGAMDLYYGDDQIVTLDPQFTRGDLLFLNRGLDASGQPDVAESIGPLGLDGFRSTMGCAFGSLTHEAGWNLFFADIFRGVMYRASGPGAAYVDVTESSGAESLRGPGVEKWVYWGGVFRDFEGDGYEDLLVGQASVHFGEATRELQGPVLLKNHGGELELVRYAFGEAMGARGTLLVDLDNDGDDDVVVVPYYSAFRFFVNESPPRAYVRLRLRGTVAGVNAAGAVIVARDGDTVQRRMVVSGCTPFASGEGVVDIAQPGADSLDVTIYWPSGAVQQLPAVATGTAMTVVEPVWLTISNPTPPADGVAVVVITLDLSAAGLGGAGSQISWTDATGVIDAAADGQGVATITLPARAAPAVVRGTLRVDGVALPVHPTVDFR